MAVAPRVQATLVLSLAAVSTLSCGAERRASLRGQMDERARELGDEPGLRAAAARGEAALADESGSVLFEGIEVRARGLSAENFSQGSDIEVSARLGMSNPWAMAADRRARRAETEVTLAELDQTSLGLRVDRCLTSMEIGAVEVRAAFYEWYRRQLEAVLEWNGQCRRAGTVDELQAQRLHLSGSVRLARGEPRPAEGVASPGFDLPAVSRPEAQLRLDPTLVAAHVAEHHPMITGHLAAKRRHEELARRAARRRLPWIEFVELAYELAPHNSAANITGQVSLELPFGLDQRAETQRQEALSRGEDFEAEALELELARHALAALRAIAFFEAQTDQLERLLDEVRTTQALAERWLGGRLGQPLDVARLIDEAFEAHDTVVEARLRAGLASCALLESTGTPLSAWPRAGDGGRHQPGGELTEGELDSEEDQP
jgi:hypothetical protein